MAQLRKKPLQFLVSIPYRSATNLKSLIEIMKDMTRFNSLQERYKQGKNPFTSFQPRQFQFLIGALQTIYQALNRVLRLGVSIPYRSATNLSRISSIFLEISCFNSLQERYKLKLWHDKYIGERSFNSLQERYKRKGKKIVFDSSRVFQFLIGALQTCGWKTIYKRSQQQFQFLIGALQTQ